MKPILATILLLTVQMSAHVMAATNLKKCLFINSYHKGYEWSDGIEQAAYLGLKDVCTVQSFYMDTKKHPKAEFAKAKGLEAKQWIEAQAPDIVIVADDPAVENVLAKYFKNSRLPFVFCGINWEAKKYELPYQNATGMIEIAPVAELVRQIKEILPNAKTAIYLSGDVSSDHVNYQVYKAIYQKYRIDLKPQFATTMKQWEKKFNQSQKSDIVILANYVGISGWTNEAARRIVQNDTRKMSVTYQEFMRPFVALSLTKIPQEQGEWAAKVAIEILDGTSPHKIPVAVNRRWNMYVNDEVAQLSHILIPEAISRKANKVAL